MFWNISLQFGKIAFLDEKLSRGILWNSYSQYMIQLYILILLTFFCVYWISSNDDVEYDKSVLLCIRRQHFIFKLNNFLKITFSNFKNKIFCICSQYWYLYFMFYFLQKQGYLQQAYASFFNKINVKFLPYNDVTEFSVVPTRFMITFVLVKKRYVCKWTWETIQFYT